MSVSNVSSVTNQSPSANQSWYQQQYQDFNSLSNALQTGNLSSAKSAFTAWQNDLQSIVPSNLQAAFQNKPFGSNNQANTDFQALSSALQAGDTSAAQQAFTSLKQDLQNTGSVHRRHPHRAETENDGNKDDGGNSSSTTASGSAQSTGSTLDTQA